MGVETKKGSRPPLPAPTETDDTSPAQTELATEVSRATDKTSYSVPEDGSPITISTRRKKHEKDPEVGITRANHQSQTSLLIEYFEGGKEGRTESRRPSVRVKVTPSSQRKGRNSNDHIQITESKGTRKPSYTKRISLSPNIKDKTHDADIDDKSMTDYASNTTGSNVTSRGGGPIEIEVMPKRHGSPLIPTESGTRYTQANASDISSMPASSFLDSSVISPRRERSRSLSRGEALAAGAATGLAAAVVADTLATPSRRRSRSLSRERIAYKAAEKVRSEKHEQKHRKHSSKSRSRSVSNSDKHTDSVRSPRRRSSRTHNDESLLSGADSRADSSLLSSQPTASHRSDAYSYRSGTSKSSINNPKLLETVEDAIRRLILPELTALKREQSRHANRDRERRGSITSGSGVSRDDGSSKRVSNRSITPEVSGSGRPKVTLNDNEVLSGRSSKERRHRKSNGRVDEGSERSFERDVSEETVMPDDAKIHKKRSSDRHHGAEALAAGAAMGALTAAALNKHDSRDSLEERKERRRRRAKSRSRSDVTVEDYAEDRVEGIPPMPFSDVNASDLTRTSILSAETDRPNSASEEARLTPLKEVSRGVASPISTISRTSNRTPVQRGQGLGMQHSNFSSNNLSLHNRDSGSDLRDQEYELDEHGRKVPMYNSPRGERYEDEYIENERPASRHRAVEAGLAGAAIGAGLGAMHHNNDEYLPEEEEHDYFQNTQSVPPPLRYVPYANHRALSPIPQSVASYREDEVSETNQPGSRLTRSNASYSSLARSAQHRHSLNSIGTSQSNVQPYNKHDFPDVRHGGLTDSELTQDGDYWEEQHRENDRNRAMDEYSYTSSDPRTNEKRMSYDSMGEPYSDVSAGQNIHGVRASKADYVHPIGVESAVASIVDSSVLTGSTGQSGQSSQRQFDRRGSYASYEEGEEEKFTSRGNSPVKQMRSPDGFEASSSRGSPEYAEYELDEHGHKVAMPKYNKSHAAEADLAGAALGAAAGAFAARHRKSDGEDYVQYSEGYGAPLQKSFKDRTLDGQVPPSPRHSIDRIIGEDEHVEMGTSGIPDIHDPMPEIGYGDNVSEVTTNPSIIQGPIGGVPYTSRNHWQGETTPVQKGNGLREAEAGLIGAAAGAGVAAAVAGHEKNHSIDGHDDEWKRTSTDRKRDTLITNPYEGTSPLSPGMVDRDLLAQGFNPVALGYSTGSPSAPLKDEGYISSAPNARSTGAATPTQHGKEGSSGDFFTSGHARQLSGYSQGLGSPLYDSATGNGIDRIKSKDIVALMDHLTVRDAQRSARDTEILVTLVRSAAEMRNSFEDMKRLLADTEDVIITEVQRNTDQSVQKAINGPRPLPGSGNRSVRQDSQDYIEDIPTKRRNVFRRALKGLSMKSTNDLTKIESMLMQLLGDVEGLKVAQGLPLRNGGDRDSYRSIDEDENDYDDQDRGYEPEGHAGTSTASHASASGHLSASRRGFDPVHRISTVPEGDEEELAAHEQNVLNKQFEQNELLTTPTRETRGGSAPLNSPPVTQVPQASYSNDNTPKTEKGKKHKSSSSLGWIPKISRWSETTASTVAKGFRSNRSSKQKEQMQQTPPSRSASALDQYSDLPHHDPYGDDRLHSGGADYARDSEDPKYKAHRNSLNLLHPQPRPGPTHRYQTALESQADNFHTPQSVKSLDWGSSTSLNRLPPNQNRFPSEGSEAGYSVTSDGLSQAPVIPPKEPVIPPKEPLDATSPTGAGGSRARNRLTKPSPLSNDYILSPGSDHDDYVMSGGYGGYDMQNASPRGGRGLGVPNSKPTGPRSMSGSKTAGFGGAGREDLGGETGTVIRREKRGTLPISRIVSSGCDSRHGSHTDLRTDTFGTIGSHHSGDSETF
jgi:hypothetical protein